MKIARFVYALVLANSSAVACELPGRPEIPGTTGDDVARVLIEVRRYSDSIAEYTQCVNDELAAMGEAAPERSTLLAQIDHAAAELDATTDLYAQHVGQLENLRLAPYLEGQGRDCIRQSSVERTRVVNEGAVIFFERGARAHLNILERACTGLDRERHFVVRSAGVGLMSGFVCDRDRIFPERGPGTLRGEGCNLARFFPLSRDQALEILEQSSEP